MVLAKGKNMLPLNGRFANRHLEEMQDPGDKDI